MYLSYSTPSNTLECLFLFSLTHTPPMEAYKRATPREAAPRLG